MIETLMSKVIPDKIPYAFPSTFLCAETKLKTVSSRRTNYETELAHV